MSQVSEDFACDAVDCGRGGQGLAVDVCAGDLGNGEGELGHLEEYAAAGGAEGVEEGEADEELGLEGCG